MKKRIPAIFFIYFVVVVSCDTENGLDPMNEEQPLQMANFTYISTNVFDQRCALSGCHLDVQNPMLKSDVAYNNIVNQPSSTGMDYIEPGDPASSYLYLKITGDPGINGLQMPRIGTPLSQVTIDSIRVWIENGALNN